MSYINIKKMRVVFLVIPVFLILPFLGFKSLDTQDYSTNELLVKLEDSPKIYKISRDPLDLDDWQKLLLEIPGVEWAEPNSKIHIAYLPSDSSYPEQWYLDKIKALQAWDIVPGGSSDITIAVLDTGVNIDHPDLKANIWVNGDEVRGDGIDNDNNGYIDDVNGWDFLRENSDPRPKFDELYSEGGIHHGTLVAGLAAAVGDNSEGIAGIAYKSKIMPLRVLDSQGEGNVEDVIQAVKYAVDNGAKIINLSFVGTTKSRFLSDALKEAWDKGVLIVAAAGNETSVEPLNLNKNPNYPICFDEDGPENFIIGVTAVDDTDKKGLFADYGSNCVDVAAPGTKIYGTLAYNPFYNFKDLYGGYWSGTSLAAPMVSGLAALTWSINPLFTQKQVQDFILNQTDKIDAVNPNFVGQLGTGRINVYKTIKNAYDQLENLPQSYYIVTGAGQGGGPHVRVFDASGSAISGFFAYHPKFSGGVNVASGDVDGDGKDEIVTGAGPGGGPHIRIFDLYGNPKGGFFAFDTKFTGGVNVACGDIDGDGKDEIIAAPGPGGGGRIRVFDWQGQQKLSFLAFQAKFKPGVNVASGDIDGDGIDEIIAGAGQGGGPHVRVFDGFGDLKLHFFAFNKNFLGGINVASGDVDGDKKIEIIVSVASNASSYVRVFDPEFLTLKLQFLATTPNFYNGVKIATADFDNNRQSEIIVGSGPKDEPKIKVFDKLGNPISQFYAYVKHFKGGVSVATIRASGY